MCKRFVIIVGVLLMVALPCSVIADGHQAKIQKYVDSSIRGWLFAPELLAAVAQQNINHMGLSGDDITNLDQQWRTEKKYHGGGDLMDSKMNNQLSAFLRGVKAASGGVIVEIFVMDNIGLNVGQTDPTGDYMQGDEAKWKKTYPVSAKAVYWITTISNSPSELDNPASSMLFHSGSPLMRIAPLARSEFDRKKMKNTGAYMASRIKSSGRNTRTPINRKR